MFEWRSLLFGVLASLLAGSLQAAPVQALDRVVAVVNSEVITSGELERRVAVVRGNLLRQGAKLPDEASLRRQVLERTIVDRIQLQKALERGLRVDDETLDETIARIAANSKLPPDQFRKGIEAEGTDWDRFREDVREELLIGQLRDRELANRVMVTDAEVEYFASSAQGGTGGVSYEIIHLLLRVPEGASAAARSVVRGRIEALHKEAASGRDFGELVRAHSEAADRQAGGYLGWRSSEQLPGLYAEAAAGLNEGAVSPVLESNAGYHLIKLVARRGGKAAEPVLQTRARHILVKVTEGASESAAKMQIDRLRERLVHGESFAELARVHGQDGTAIKGGDLGWVLPGDLVPPFEKAMNALAPGTVSAPVRTPFGWHLIEVLERKNSALPQDRQNELVRSQLRQRKMDEASADWLQQLRQEAYVDIRLEQP